MSDERGYMGSQALLDDASKVRADALKDLRAQRPSPPALEEPARPAMLGPIQGTRPGTKGPVEDQKAEPRDLALERTNNVLRELGNIREKQLQEVKPREPQAPPRLELRDGRAWDEMTQEEKEQELERQRDYNRRIMANPTTESERLLGEMISKSWSGPEIKGLWDAYIQALKKEAGEKSLTSEMINKANSGDK